MRRRVPWLAFWCFVGFDLAVLGAAAVAGEWGIAVYFVALLGVMAVSGATIRRNER